MYPVLWFGEFRWGLAGLGLSQLPISNHFGLKSCVTDLYRKFVSDGKAFPEATLSGFVFEELSFFCNSIPHGSSRNQLLTEQNQSGKCL